MKSPLYFWILLVHMFFTGPSALAQHSQSAIYDAIALMNAKHGINVIMMPDARGYHTIDPLTGVLGGVGQTAPLPATFTDSADSEGIIIRILARNVGLPDTASRDEIKTAYASNPFLKDILDVAPKRFGSGSILLNQIEKLFVDSQSGLGTTSVFSNLSNGTADFLIKRAQGELSVAVIQRLKDFTKHYSEFDVLFPRTMNLIKPVAAYDYAKTLNAMKSALQEDFSHFPAHLPGLYSIPRYQEYNKRVPLMTLLFTASEMLTALDGKKNISRSIHDLDTCRFLEAQNNYSGFVRVVVLASDNLRKKTLAQAEGSEFDYISTSEIEKITNGKLANKAELARYFLGLLYQKGKNIPFWSVSGNVTASALLEGWEGSSDIEFGDLLDKVSVASETIQKLAMELPKIKEADNGTSPLWGKPFFSPERYVIYNQVIMNTILLCEPFIADRGTNTLVQQELQRISGYWPTFSGHTINMIKALSQQEYSLAIDDLVHLLDLVSRYMEDRKGEADFKKDLVNDVNGRIDQDVKAINNRIMTIKKELNAINGLSPTTLLEKATVYDQKESLSREQDYLEQQLKELDWQKKNADKYVFKLYKVTEYYKLFAALGQAENGQQVESLLESYALPSGSSRIKKETDFNLAFNAYVGGYFARNKTGGTGFSNQYGLTAPIGLALSRGWRKAGSASLLAGMFDIGGIIRYKLDNEGAYQQDVNLVGLISPSLQVVYGFPFYLPLSFGAGWQWTTPVTASSNKIHLKPHFNLFLAVDIPMFNLSVVRKK
ncbi:hypothetical protein [Parapedobacter koreensis]|uniref:Uncharacterized protein n=1 Tax=Parapedobacter koreensis TaxID=332977 RepID=A0A1H7F126_9SPHI|nr:hypothetical protein [Parapedobacter koreensis]SEK17700.1 hypothetical protein SAMN05421740_10121 [Parapedobacter koreensis]